MALSIGIGAPAGYAPARFRFPGRNAFRMLVLMTRAFPLPLLALPLAVFFIEHGLDDSVVGLALVHTTLALPFAILITSSLFLSIPVELEEAAWTLGCIACRRPPAHRAAACPSRDRGVRRLRLRDVLERSLRRGGAHHREQDLTAFLLQSLDVSPSALKFAGGAVLVFPALVFLFAVRKYLFSLWGIANR